MKKNSRPAANNPTKKNIKTDNNSNGSKIPPKNSDAKIFKSKRKLHRKKKRKAGLSTIDMSEYLSNETKGIRFRCSKYYRILLMQKLLMEGQNIPPQVESNDYSNCPDSNFRVDETFGADPIYEIPLISDKFGLYNSLLIECSFNFSIRSEENDTKIHFFVCSDCSPSKNEPSKCSILKDSPPESLQSEYCYNCGPKLVAELISHSKSIDAEDVVSWFLMTKPEVESYTMPAKEFITSCIFDNMHCSPSDLEEWISDMYGRCYTFNSFYGGAEVKGKKPKRNIKKARTDGPKSGLKLTLNLNAEEALSLFSPDRGVRVIVHSPKAIPFPEEEGFNVQPDASTDIQLNIKRYQRVTPPHGVCRNKIIDSKYSYTQMLCRKICLEKYIREECRCKFGLSPAYDQIPNDTMKTCEGNNVVDKFCLEIAQFKFAHRLLDCDCPIMCDEYEYDTKISSSHTDISYFKIIQNIKETRTGYDVCSGSTNNTVRFHVYLQKLTYESIKESPSYSFDTLISNLGGSLGLFMGMSIVSMVELVVFIVDLTYEFFKKKEKLQEQKKQKNQEKWTPVFVVPQTEVNDMIEAHSVVKSAWSEQKKEKVGNYFSKIFYDEE